MFDDVYVNSQVLCRRNSHFHATPAGVKLRSGRLQGVGFTYLWLARTEIYPHSSPHVQSFNAS